MAGIHTTWEKRPDNGSRKRPDAGYQTSTGTVETDTTIRHPVSNTAMRVVRFKRGAVLNAAVKEKIRKYEELARDEGSRFTALAISAYGHFHKDNIGVLSDLALGHLVPF